MRKGRFVYVYDEADNFIFMDYFNIDLSMEDRIPDLIRRAERETGLSLQFETLTPYDFKGHIFPDHSVICKVTIVRNE